MKHIRVTSKILPRGAYTLEEWVCTICLGLSGHFLFGGLLSPAETKCAKKGFCPAAAPGN